jgi:selenocysteine-specific elongation factor
LDRLRESLLELCRRLEPRPWTGPFRLAVDRQLLRQGIGVVVAGTAVSGVVRVGDTLELLPQGRTVRVRSLQSFGEDRREAGAGERVALALQGIKPGDVQRGDVLATPGAFRAVRVVDARVWVSGYRRFEIRTGERLRIHHGAREVYGRVTLLDRDRLGSEESAYARLRLEEPLVVAPGDPLVIRKISPPRVVGGGRVIREGRGRARRFDPAVLDRLKRLEGAGPAERFRVALEEAGWAGLPAEEVPEELRGESDPPFLRLGDRVIARAWIDRLGEGIAEAARAYLERHPLLFGPDREELRRRVRFPGTPAEFARVVEVLEREGRVECSGLRVRPAGWKSEVPAGYLEALDRLEERVASAGLRFPSLEELRRDWREELPFEEALQALLESGKVERVGEGLIHRDAADRAVRRIAETFEERESLTVAEIKELLGLTRKHAIPLLEWLDGRGITRRVGNTRKVGPALEKG